MPQDPGQKTEQVRRFDTARLARATKTAQGYLRAPARATRTGVLEYKRQDGTTRRELRLPEEVFKTDSMATLSMAPVTDLHPSEMVTPANHSRYAKGMAGESPRQDGKYLATEVLVTHADAIEAVERGDRGELSCGYTCMLELTPGTYQGQRYDAIQRNIVYNHIALLPKGAGRAGSDVSLRLDSSDAIARFDDADDMPQDDHHKTPRSDSTMETTVIRIDGVDFEVRKDAAQMINRELERRDSALNEIWADSEKKSGRIDALEAEKAELKKTADAAEDPKEIQKRVDARVELVSQTRKILGEDAKLDGLSDRELREAVVQKARGEDVKLDSLSDDYLAGQFEALVATAAAKPAEGERKDAKGALAKTRAAAVQAETTERKDAKSARQEMIERNRNMWRPAKQ